MIKVSVIIPIYNAEKYLSTCLKSVIEQTLEEVEIICIDDGSIDKSISILQSYQTDRRFIILKQKNSGAGLARNRGMQIAKGKYITFIDADDWYPENDVLEFLFRKAEENQALICGGNLLRSTDSGVCIKDSKEKKEGFILYKDYQGDCYFSTYIYNLSMLKRNRIKFPQYRIFEDPPFLVKAMIVAGQFYRINKEVYCYRLVPKKTIWDKEKTNDLVSGIIDNIILSRIYNLEKLHCLCARYIEEDFFHCIIKNFNQNNLKMNHLLLKANEELDFSIINKYRKETNKNKVLFPLKIGMCRHQSFYYYMYKILIVIKRIQLVLIFLKRYGWKYTLEKIKTNL